MLKKIKEIFRKKERPLTHNHVCEHEWEICKKAEPFMSLRGEQLYKRCLKCGKVEEYIFREYEGGGYK